MAVFFLAEIESISDPDTYDRYKEKVAPVVRKYGGEYIIRSDKLRVISGSWNAERVILLRFDSRERLQSCFGSSEYREIAHLREHSTVSKAMIIEE